MQIPTHILSGWCAANLFSALTPKQRLMSMIAATIPDLDGLSMFLGQQSYWHWDHRLSHNLPFGLIACLALTLLSGRRLERVMHFLVPRDGTESAQMLGANATAGSERPLER